MSWKRMTKRRKSEKKLVSYRNERASRMTVGRYNRAAAKRVRGRGVVRGR